MTEQRRALLQSIAGQLGNELTSTDFSLRGQVGKHVGKVRESYLLGDGRRVIITTDRISAFDVILGTIPWKGQVLNQLAAHWFVESAKVAPNHFLSMPDPAVMVVRQCQALPVEMVMRAYLTGVTGTSIWHAYSQGARTFCGHRLPEGLRKNQALPQAILTPSTKADKGGHDESVAPLDLVERGLLDQATLDQASDLCKTMFAFGQARAKQRGLILVDTKYELGVCRFEDGSLRLVFIDEVHTPDSSRYWFESDYEDRLAKGQEPRSLDKEYVRRYLAEAGYTGQGAPPPLPEEVRIEAAARYIEAYERLTGGPFFGNREPPLERIRDNLQKHGLNNA